MNKLRLRAYLMLLIVALIWGIASPVIKFTLQGFNPLIFLTYRFGISAILSIIIFSIVGWHIPKDTKTLWILILYAFLTSTISLGMLFLGLKKATVLDSSLIILIAPLITSLAGVFFLKETITKREKIGMSIAVLGTLITMIGQTKSSGNILIFGYVFITAIGAVLAKKLLRNNVRPLTMTNFSFIIGFLTLLPFALFSEVPINAVLKTPFIYHIGVWFMALLSGNLAYYLSNRAQKTIEISESSLFSYIIPIISTPIAILWLGEKINITFIIGAVIVSFGVVIAEIKKKRYNSH